MMPEVNSGAVFNQRAQPQVQQIESQGIQFKSNVCCSLLGVVRLLTIVTDHANEFNKKLSKIKKIKK